MMLRNVMLLALCVICGCNTPRGHDGSLTDGIAILAVQGAMLPIAAPWLAVGAIKTAAKKDVYAPVGITRKEFEKFITQREPEGFSQEGRKGRDGTTRYFYTGKKTRYLGRFNADGISVKY